MASKTEISNMALVNLGITTLISSLTERSVEAKLCKLYIDSVIKEVLRDFDWNFAKRTVSLSLLNDSNEGKFQYSYLYPSECVKFLKISSGAYVENNNTKIPFEIELNDSDKKIIKTNEYQATGVYTKYIEDPSLYPEDFISAISYMLSFKIAPGLDRAQRRNDMFTIYDDVISRAKKNAGNEIKIANNNSSEFLRARS